MKNPHLNPVALSRLVNAAAVLCLLSTGCSSERKPVNEKPVVPVSGVVHVNGKPTAGIKIKFHAATQQTSHHVFPKATTGSEGKFTAWTYRIDDGLPPGDYTLTFIDHSKKKPMMRESNAPDLLRGKYSNPKNAEHKITVPEGSEPIVMDTIELRRP